jgi:hypothetical protein
MSGPISEPRTKRGLSDCTDLGTAKIIVDDTFALTVEADPDPSGEALPRRFCLGARVVKVTEILDRWPGAGHLYVKLRGSDGATYILRQDLGRGYWRLVLFRDQRAVDWVG